jgi:hypothetical protein
MPTVEERTNILQNKIASVERAIHEQVAENKRLLNLLKPQDGHMNAALPSPGLDTIPVLKNAASSNSAHDPIVILVFACNRAKAIQSHLDQIFRCVKSVYFQMKTIGVQIAAVSRTFSCDR